MNVGSVAAIAFFTEECVVVEDIIPDLHSFWEVLFCHGTIIYFRDDMYGFRCVVEYEN